MPQDRGTDMIMLIAGSMLGAGIGISLCFAAHNHVDETLLVIGAGASAIVGTVLTSVGIRRNKGDDD